MCACTNQCVYKLLASLPITLLLFLCDAAGKLPAMETSSFNAPAALVQESEVGPVPRADTTTLGAYLGNSDLVLQEAALGAQGAAAAAGLPCLTSGTGSTVSRTRSPAAVGVQL